MNRTGTFHYGLAFISFLSCGEAMVIFKDRWMRFVYIFGPSAVENENWPTPGVLNGHETLSPSPLYRSRVFGI